MMNTFSYIFLIALILNFAAKMWLNLRHNNHVNANRHQVPDAFLDKLTLEDHQKAADYTVAKSKYGRFSMVYSTLILLSFTLFGGLGYLDVLWSTTNNDPVTTGVWYIASISLIYIIITLPESIYFTFVLEEKFGFNNTKVKTFIADIVKTLIIMTIIGIPLVWIILWLMQSAGSLWWVYAWAVFCSFNLFAIWAYPVLIAPIFNKFTPLDDPELKTKIDSLLGQCGFASKGVFVMDGSKRSSHGNAFFAGMGNNKRIVFFDTLLKYLSHEEIEAVLAHELGHFRLNHIKKQFALSLVVYFISFAILGLLLTKSWFFSGMGISNGPSNHVGLMLFLLVTPVFTFLLDPIFSFISRKYEFEADEYASKTRSSLLLISALVKLNREEKATVTPDPLYSMMYDSHPPAPIRINQLYEMRDPDPNKA